MCVTKGTRKDAISFLKGPFLKVSQGYLPKSCHPICPSKVFPYNLSFLHDQKKRVVLEIYAKQKKLEKVLYLFGPNRFRCIFYNNRPTILSMMRQIHGVMVSVTRSNLELNIRVWSKEQAFFEAFGKKAINDELH